jgi:hypothetical protein
MLNEKSKMGPFSWPAFIFKPIQNLPAAFFFYSNRSWNPNHRFRPDCTFSVS